MVEMTPGIDLCFVVICWGKNWVNGKLFKILMWKYIIHLFIYLLTYLLNYLFTHLFIYLITYLLNYILTYLLTNSLLGSAAL